MQQLQHTTRGIDLTIPSWELIGIDPLEPVGTLQAAALPANAKPSCNDVQVIRVSTWLLILGKKLSWCLWGVKRTKLKFGSGHSKIVSSRLMTFMSNSYTHRLD